MTDSITATESPKRARARRGEGDLLRDEILDATDRLLAEHGDIEMVSIRMIADAVGVTAPSIYRHFADKDALTFACCNRHFQGFRTALGAAAQGHSDNRRALRAMGRAYYDWALANPIAYRLMFLSNKCEPPADLPEDEFHGKQALMDLAGIVSAGIASGEFRDCDPTTAALGVWAMVHGVAALQLTVHDGEWKAHMPEHDHEQVIEFVLDTVEAGFMTPA